MPQKLVFLVSIKLDITLQIQITNQICETQWQLAHSFNANFTTNCCLFLFPYHTCSQLLNTIDVLHCYLCFINYQVQYIRKIELFVRYKLQLTKIIASQLDVSNIKRFAEKKPSDVLWIRTTKYARFLLYSVYCL